MESSGNGWFFIIYRCPRRGITFLCHLLDGTLYVHQKTFSIVTGLGFSGQQHRNPEHRYLQQLSNSETNLCIFFYTRTTEKSTSRSSAQCSRTATGDRPKLASKLETSEVPASPCIVCMTHTSISANARQGETNAASKKMRASYQCPAASTSSSWWRTRMSN